MMSVYASGVTTASVGGLRVVQSQYADVALREVHPSSDASC